MFSNKDSSQSSLVTEQDTVFLLLLLFLSLFNLPVFHTHPPVSLNLPGQTEITTVCLKHRFIYCWNMAHRKNGESRSILKYKH